MRLLEQVVATGCKVSIDSDAHAVGQLEWQPYGCARAAEAGVPPDDIVNTWNVDRLLEWTASHAQ
jgi:putative hydrolase